MTDLSIHQSSPAKNLALGLALLLGSYLLITSTVSLSDTFWLYDVKRFLQICLLPLIFATVLFNRTLRDGFLAQYEKIPPWMLAALGLLISLGILSSAINGTTGMAVLYSLSEVLLHTLLVLAALCVAACRMVGGKVFDQAAVLLLALLLVAVGLQELMGVIAALSSGMSFNPAIVLLHFSWPRFYNQVQSWIMPVVAALPLVFPGKVSCKVLCVTALSLGWYVIVATGGRGSMVGLVIAMTAGYLLLPVTRKLLIRYQLAGVFGGLLIYALVVWGHQILATETRISRVQPNHSSQTQTPSRPAAAKKTAKRSKADNEQKFTGPLTSQRMITFSERLPLWQASIRDARSHPWLGIGPMNFACKGPIYRAASPHNFALQILGEWGIPAFLLLALIVGFLVFKVLALLRKPAGPSVHVVPLASFIAMGVLAAAVHAGVSGVLEMPASQVAGVLICGSLLGMLPTKTSTRTALSTGVIVLSLSLVLSLSFLAFARHELAISQMTQEQTPLMDRLIPRLWQNGKVCRLYQ